MEFRRLRRILQATARHGLAHARLQATFRYIARNPVVAKIVAAPVEYAYGGVRHIRDGDWSLIDRSEAAPAIVEAGLMLPILLPA